MAAWQSFIWDSTIGDTVAPSYLQSSAKTPGFVAEQAERRKHNHYVDLKKNYFFAPVSFETFGTMGSDTKKFIDAIGKHLQIVTGDLRAKDYFLQRISVELQRGNAVSILCTSKNVDNGTVDEFYNTILKYCNSNYLKKTT